MAERQQPSPPASATGFAERRRGYRQAVRVTAMLRPLEGSAEQALAVHVFEYSISGVAFSMGAAPPIGSVWRFDMCDRRQAGRRIEVRSCRPRRDGMFDVGASSAECLRADNSAARAPLSSAAAG